MIIQEEDYLAHYGILRKSGRYPWGSGEDVEQRSRDFLGTVADLRKQGLTDPEIARGMALYTENGKPWTTTDFRAANSIAGAQKKAGDISQAQRLKDKGYSNVAIGQRMGINESSVRSLLAPGQKDKADILETTSSFLRDQVAEKKYVDVGAGVEHYVGISDVKLKTAVAMLQEEGYKKYYVKVPQLGTNHETNVKVLVAPGVTYSEVYKNRDKIQQIQGFSEDGGRSILGVKPPLSIDSKRVAVRYAEEGGKEADGVIYVRPGVKDTSLGASNYAQVRIMVDGTHYLKGMAMYKDDLPAGVDLQFNTNKSNTGNKLDAMKEIKSDPDNPFGATIRQRFDEHGKVNNVMNIVGIKEGSGEEGSWDTWSRNLSTQFLSKQSPTLAKTQLDMTFEQKQNEFANIKRLTNPTVRRKLLQSFSDDADSSAVHLKAAALPRQSTHVILPVNSLKDTEVYAPNFNSGERVVLIRHPHGGKFEIPELVVNNKNPEAVKLLGKHAQDAIGINSKVAERLSGADFDGDAVIVIPNNSRRIKTENALASLKNFDPQRDYAPYDGMKTIDGGTYNAATRKVDYHGRSPVRQTKQNAMGRVSNLITDMTIKGANNTELAAAVRHSMVVIDAEKHSLDYKRSAIENGIPALVKKYQERDDGKTTGGSATLISLAKSRADVAERKQGYRIDPTTGEKIFTDKNSVPYVNAKGKIVVRTTRSTKLAETKDAHDLSSGTRIEEIYANHSNKLKALANEARLAQLNTPTLQNSASAAKVYAEEAKSLNAKLRIAERNAPLERQAQVLANAVVRAKREANPNMDSEELKKIKNQALVEQRLRTGAGKQRIEIEDKEWEAIQAGAISNARLKKILDNTDLDRVKQLATPREPRVMTSIMQARAKAMLNSGYTQADVASQLGVAVSTLKSSLSE